MGCFGSKDKLSKEDMDFLKSHTRYDETTIKEWYKGFKVISDDINWAEAKKLLETSLRGVKNSTKTKSFSSRRIDKTQEEF